jgi:UDP-glucose 4-epimerase
VSESIDPQPTSPNGLALKTGEQYCRYYHEQYGLNSTIVRVPFIYSPEEPNTLLHDLIRTLHDKNKLIFPSGEAKVYSFLHAADVAEFVLRSIDDYYPSLQTVNLSSADPLTFSELAEMLKGPFLGRLYLYGKDTIIPSRRWILRQKCDDWCKLSEALPGMIEAVRQETTVRSPLAADYSALTTIAVLKWLEVLAGAALMVYLNELSGTLVEFRYVDFRLIYVVLIGLIYGTQMGLIASGLAALSLLFSWVRLDLNWVELVFNVASWLPFAVYLIAVP